MARSKDGKLTLLELHFRREVTRALDLSSKLTWKLISAPEGDGYALSVVNRRDTMLSQVVVVDTAKVAEGPGAIIELPFRLRSGIHGTWVMADELATDKDLCDMTGVTDDMKKSLGSRL